MKSNCLDYAESLYLVAGEPPRLVRRLAEWELLATVRASINLFRLLLCARHA